MFEILLWLNGFLFGIAIGIIIGTIAGASTHHKCQLPPHECSGLHFQFSLKDWFPIGRPFLGTKRVRLVDVKRTSLSRHFTVDVATACSRRKGLRHTAPLVAECMPSRAKRRLTELFKKVCSQFLPCMNAGVSLEDLDES